VYFLDCLTYYSNSMFAVYTIWQNKQVCLRLPTYDDNVALPAFTRRTPLLQRSIDISCASGPHLQQIYSRTDRQTRRQTEVKMLRSRIVMGLKEVKVAHTRLSAGNVSHKPGGRLPLFSARPAVTIVTLKGLVPVSLLDEQRHNGCEQFA